MTHVLHDIEKRIIEAIRDDEGAGRPPYQKGSLKDTATLHATLGEMTGLSLDQVRRGIEWLKLKNLICVDSESKRILRLAVNGRESFENGLPERRLLDLLSGDPRSLYDLQDVLGSIFGSAMGIARKNGWIKVSGGSAILLKHPPEMPAERSLKLIAAAEKQSTAKDTKGRNGLSEDSITPEELASLDRPGFLDVTMAVKMSVSLSDSAQFIDLSKSDGIDVEADVPSLVVARRHPLKDVIDEIREIFVTLGFTEISGDMTQSSFWNFDALFTPQDHPAREMQDTFYLDSTTTTTTTRHTASDLQMRRVSESHQRNWRYKWDAEQARRMVLRTHTTCVTIRNLAEHRPKEARLFSLGRVFRNEKVSYKHLVEFNQVEGVMIGRNATLRDLMGIQKEFYRRIGITKVKFWPTFFPYTEPSLQTMVYNEKLGKWVELFGMGIFRREVTKPLGIDRPVLAWGGGIERIAMLRYDLNDVREFYNNNLDWLRNAVKCR